MTATVKAAVIVTEFHKAIAAAIGKADKAATTLAGTIRHEIGKRYGDTMPMYLEYMADQIALDNLAKAKGLADNQHYRKVYAKFINEMYGALPVSLAEDAAKKRAQREREFTPEQRVAAAEAEAKAKRAGKKDHEVVALAAEAARKAKGKKQEQPGAPAGEVKDQAPSADESIEQMIARIGVAATLQAVAKILKSEAATKLQAKTLESIAAAVGKAA